MIMKAMSVDLMKEGIGVLMLHPGRVQTEMGGPGAGTAITTTESVQGNRLILGRRLKIFAKFNHLIKVYFSLTVLLR